MNELTAKYRAVFVDNPVGAEVLADILTMTHFGEMLDAGNSHRTGEYNVGIGILAKIGVFSGDTRADVIRALTRIVPKDTGEKRKGGSLK